MRMFQRISISVKLNELCDSVDECEEYKEAIKILEKKKEDLLLLVRTKLNLSIANANNLAEFERKRVEEVYEVDVAP